MHTRKIVSLIGKNISNVGVKMVLTPNPEMVAIILATRQAKSVRYRFTSKIIRSLLVDY